MRLSVNSRLVAAAVVIVLLALFSANLSSYAGGPLTIPPTPLASPVAPDGPPGGGTLLLIEHTDIPPRDRIDLARRLLDVTDIPAPPTVAPPELALGAIVPFTAENLDEDYTFQVDAELVYKTDHIYVFVETGQQVDLEGLKRSADQFELVIRPRIHEVFGSEWSPGIDGDPHIAILHVTRLGGWVAAYYGSSSQYPVEAVDGSNEREMFFVNLDSMGWAIGTEYYEGVLAHEFQHMVHWVVDANEDTWMNEGLSELAAMIAGYGPSDFAPDFLTQAGLQLNDWPEEGDRGIHYGAAFMFLAYFYQRYGDEATTTLVRNPANGLTAVDMTLHAIGAADPSTGAPVALVDLFADWLVTNLLLDPSVGDGRYAYTFDEMQSFMPASPTRELDANGSPLSLSAPQWGPNYLSVRGGASERRVRVTFKGAETVGVVPTTAHSGQQMWWSNRGDDSDMRLTRAFDLRGASSVTLRFWLWHYIENLWDYGYVMVSTDGGATWTPLETPRTTTEDPHGNAYGPGYTGQSALWVEETIDLTPYAGQEILLRFEYITDEAVTQPGMLIDDVSVPEIGYAEDFENGDGGWFAEGWLLTDNVLPQPFLVQLVQAQHAAQPVTRLLGEGDLPHGEWEITIGGKYGDAVIVVSGLAPVTTEPANYTITLAPVQ